MLLLFGLTRILYNCMQDVQPPETAEEAAFNWHLLYSLSCQRDDLTLEFVFGQSREQTDARLTRSQR